MEMSKSYFSLSATLFSLAYRLAASLSRCCGYGYRIVAVDGGRCVIQRRQQIFLDVADILPCSYIIILPGMHLPRVAFSGTAVIQQITQIKKKSPKSFRFQVTSLVRVAIQNFSKSIVVQFVFEIIG